MTCQTVKDHDLPHTEIVYILEQLHLSRVRQTVFRQNIHAYVHSKVYEISNVLHV